MPTTEVPAGDPGHVEEGQGALEQQPRVAEQREAHDGEEAQRAQQADDRFDKTASD